MGRQDREDCPDPDAAQPPKERLPPIIPPALAAVAIAAALLEASFFV